MNTIKSMTTFNLKRVPRFLKFGVPFLAFVVAASFGLSEFTEIKIKTKDERVHKLTAEEAMQYQKKRKSTPVSIEEALEKVQKNLNIDDWENKRGPRAWEENFDISKQKLSQEKL